MKPLIYVRSGDNGMVEICTVTDRGQEIIPKPPDAAIRLAYSILGEALRLQGCANSVVEAPR